MNNNKKIIIIIFLAALSLFNTSVFAFTFFTGSNIYPTLPVNWDISPCLDLEQITIDNNGSSYQLLSNQGILEIVDFDKQIQWSSEKIVENDGTVKKCQESLNEEVSVIQMLKSYEDRFSWTVSLRNNVQRDVKLEIILKLPLQETNGFNYWDGAEVHSLSEGRIMRKTLVHTFPVSFLYNDNYGFAVGLAPETMISHLENGIDEQGNLYYSTKVALPPKMETKIEFVLFAVKPNFGHLDAITGYYRRFPTYFEPSPRVDPRIASMGISASYSSRYADLSNSKQTARTLGSFYATWDWGYVPFKRCGDFYGKEEFWDWEMTEAEAKAVAEKTISGKLDLFDLDNFHKERKTLFENADLKHNCNLAFYMINWIEKKYVEEKGWLNYTYPFMGTPLRSRWVTGISPEYHIYPWASPFEEIIKNDFPLLIDELNLKAIAIDNFFNSDTYRGELDYPIEGWSYDSRGKFISTSIGTKYWVDYLKQFEKDGFEIGIVGNARFTPHEKQEFTSVFYADAFIVEGEFYNELAKGNNGAMDDMFKYRYLAGHKPVYSWHHFYQFNIGEYVNWEAMSPEEIRLLYQNVLREIIQAAYQYGFTPIANAVTGNELIIRELPTLLDVQMRGFEPLPAAEGNVSLLRQRYGLGLNSAIVISNPTYERITTQEKIYNRYLSDYEVMPANYLGKPLELSVVQGETSINTEIASIQNEIVIFPLGIKFADKGILISGISSGQIGIDKSEYIFELESNKAIEIDLLPSDSEQWYADELFVNGLKIAHPYRASLLSGVNTLRIIYKSKLFKASKETIIGFKYLDAEIIVSNGADKREKAAAQMIQGYFELNEERTIPIFEGNSADPLKNTIIFENTSDPSNTGIFISSNGKHLIIRGQNTFDIQQKTWRLLHVLDNKYPFLGATSFSKTRTREMMEKAGLLGKPVPVIEDLVPSIKNISRKEILKQPDIGDLPAIIINQMEQEPILDGKLIDDVWEKAKEVDNFTLLQAEGKPTQKTIAKVFYTNNAFFIGFICYEKNMKDLFAYINEHDGPAWLDDEVEVFLAPGINETDSRYPYYQYIVNTQATRYESYDKDIEYNGEWIAATYKGEDFWSVEIKIPFSQLKKPDSKVWRFNLARGDRQNGEWITWAPMRGLLDQPNLFGVLYLE